MFIGDFSKLKCVLPPDGLPGHNLFAERVQMMTYPRPALIVFSGLPGTGKTTVSHALAVRLCAFYLRIDTIEQAMRSAGAKDIGPAGYAVANAIAEANLMLGHSVVADCVNPVRASRLGWGAVAARACARLIDIHLICSDVAEHRRRVTGRISDIPGLSLPTWEAVIERRFEAREDDYLLLDTAILSPTELVDCCERHVAACLGTSRDAG